MEKKQVSNVTVNDGNGLYDNEGLCETLINDLNNLIKEIASGQYIRFCIFVTQMSQKLINLKEGIKTDLASKDDEIESLKEQAAILEQRLDEERKKHKSDG